MRLMKQRFWQGCMVGVAMFAASIQVQAAPTFYFDGDFTFDSSTGLLTVDAIIDGTEELSYGSDLPGACCASVCCGLDTKQRCGFALWVSAMGRCSGFIGGTGYRGGGEVNR